jgi:tRNA-dihydrouridine synthase
MPSRSFTCRLLARRHGAQLTCTRMVDSTQFAVRARITHATARFSHPTRNIQSAEFSHTSFSALPNPPFALPQMSNM